MYFLTESEFVSCLFLIVSALARSVTYTLVCATIFYLLLRLYFPSITGYLFWYKSCFIRKADKMKKLGIQSTSFCEKYTDTVLPSVILQILKI